MRKDRQTAGEAKRLIEQTVNNLPKDERERLFLMGDTATVDADDVDLAEAFFGCIMAMPERERGALIFAVLKEMPKKERRRWIRYLERPRDWMLDYVMVKQKYVATMAKLTKASVEAAISGYEVNQQLKKKALAGPKARAANTRTRNEKIKELLVDGRSKNLVYEIMRERHPELMRGRQKGTFITQEKWWESYSKHLKNNPNCNNGPQLQ